MEFILNLLLLFLWSIVIFLLYKKYGICENMFSPLNLYLYANVIGIIIFCFFINNVQSINYKPPYFKESNIDWDVALITIFLYFISSLITYLTLYFFRYKPLYIKKYRNLNLTKNFKFLFLFFSIFYISIIFKNINALLPLNYLSLNKFRYELSHGYIVVFNIFGFSLFNLVFLFLFKKLNLSFRWKLIFFFATIFWFLLFLLNNARGPFIFGILFSLSILPGLSFLEIIKKIKNYFIDKKLAISVISIFIIIFFYQWYSNNFRAQEGVFYELILQRMDNFIASYIAISHNTGGFRLENLIYPLIYLIPRNIFPEKPFPINGILSEKVLGVNLLGDEAWSVNFGIAAESFYISYGLFIVLSSIFIALSVYYYRKILSKIITNQKISFVDFVIIVNLYIYPFGILMGGFLTPSTGNLIIILMLKLFINLVKNISKRSVLR